MEPIRLTRYVQGEGAPDPAALAEIFAPSTGPDGSPGAARYALEPGRAVVLASRLYAPVVDAPRDFGRIAAACALGAVYAAGAEPVLASALHAFPVNELPLEAMQEIVTGAAETCRTAGLELMPGQGADNAVPLFGLSVVGLREVPATGQAGRVCVGDRLILTKPLGLGVLTTAMRLGLLGAEVQRRTLEVLCTLNREGVWLARQAGVHALGEVGSSGLAGEAVALTRAAGARARILATRVPVLPAAVEFAAKGVVPRAAERNRLALGRALAFAPTVATGLQRVLTDPQISGGLLLAVAAEAQDWVLARLHEAGASDSVVIGEIVPGAPGVDIVAE